MNEPQRHTNAEPSEPVTLESMAETIEQLRKAYPEMSECSHPELVSVQQFRPSERGTRYTCTRCFKSIVIPAYGFVERGAKGFAEVIGEAFGSAWEQKAKEQNT